MVGAGMSLSDFDRVLDQLYGGQPSYTGKTVSSIGAMAISTVWSCVNVLSQDIATLPQITYRKTKNGREKAEDHYLWPLLMQEANGELTAFRFKQLMMAWICLWGNAYAEIEINKRGQVVGLWPWRPDRVTVWRESKDPRARLMYTYRLTETQETFTVPADKMLHIRGLGVNGTVGLNPIEVHRQTMGVWLATQEHGARFFANGARPLGVLEHPGKLSVKAEESLRQSWIKGHQGLSNAYRVAILEEGMKYQEVGLKMVDAQYLETINATNEDVARIFNVPQHRIGLLARATFNNIEHLGLEYVLYTLGPIAVNIEQQIEASLLSPRERETIFTKFNFRNLLRGDHAAMAQFLTQLIDRGIISADEARDEYLDMNPQPKGIGTDYWKAVNMAPIGADGLELPTPPAPAVPPGQKNEPGNAPTVKKVPPKKDPAK